MEKRFFLVITLLLITNMIYSQVCPSTEEAKKHWYKAEGIREASTNESDYQLARDEYLKALQYEPRCPDIYFNLGACCEEIGKIDISQFDAAISYFNKYLNLLPNAADKEDVQMRIYKIEGKKEKFQKDVLNRQKNDWKKIKELEGKWEPIDNNYPILTDFKLVVDSKGLKIIPDMRTNKEEGIIETIFDEGYISIKDGILHFSLNSRYPHNSGSIGGNGPHVYRDGTSGGYTSYCNIYGTMELTSDGNLKCNITIKFIKDVNNKTGEVYYCSGYYAETGVTAVVFYRKKY